MTCFYVKGILDALTFLKMCLCLYHCIYPTLAFTASGPTFFGSNS